ADPSTERIVPKALRPSATQVRIPDRAELTCPASSPSCVTVEPMACATVNKALLRLSLGKLWCSSPRNLPPALPASSTGHSALVCVLPHAVSDVTNTSAVSNRVPAPYGVDLRLVRNSARHFIA